MGFCFDKMVNERIAFLFPGQGSQYVGMGRDFYEGSRIAAEMFEEANEILGFNLSSLCFHGPEEILRLTENTQPAIFIVSVIIFEILKEKGIIPCISAGHSLGEYSALYAAGSLNFSEGIHLVRLRGRFMQEAVPVGKGAMAAVIGLGRELIEGICEKITGEGRNNDLVQPANYNSPEQIVIAGEKEAVERAVKITQDMGAKKVVMLSVSAPFHTKMMKPAEDRLSIELDTINFKELIFPVITNVDAKAIKNGDEARMALKRQVSNPVRWAESMKLMIDSGVEIVIEVGPGKVLSGLLKRFAVNGANLIKKDMRCLHVEDMKSLEKTLKELRVQELGS